MTRNYSAWRRASLTAPRNFPLCVHAGNKKKLTKGSLREAIFTARPPQEQSQGQVQMQMQDTPLLCTEMCRPHLETEQCGKDYSWQLRLCSPSSKLARDQSHELSCSKDLR